jgi:hypothetical protein
VSASSRSQTSKNYDQLEPALVPEDTRLADKYGGYSLSFVLDDIGIKLESSP